MEFPEGLLYTSQHQWLRMDPDSTVVIGITDFAQDELGDIVYVDLPRVGDSVAKDMPFGELESTKTSSEVYAPCSGEILEVNSELDGAPDRMNSDPYGQGWVMRVRPSDPLEFKSLLDSSTYRRSIEG
ncbi:glycine cleavage system H protein [Modestobacter sp. DSM 44400]|uniref:glycine cleavage system protein GcvH n=1 Tax=Modestobacter sp. DSM 44400 TaxID=1550230 RepID=UPI00089D1A7C|nr:glycine cleavage system protein GcvH [Modestobacter sp. DSM 44400]SDY87896.1 glycine cleavage system H protein [Modestobacter sp. DSM 44400]